MSASAPASTTASVGSPFTGWSDPLVRARLHVALAFGRLGYDVTLNHRWDTAPFLAVATAPGDEDADVEGDPDRVVPERVTVVLGVYDPNAAPMSPALITEAGDTLAIAHGECAVLAVVAPDGRVYRIERRLGDDRPVRVLLAPPSGSLRAAPTPDSPDADTDSWRIVLGSSVELHTDLVHRRLFVVAGGQ